MSTVKPEPNPQTTRDSDNNIIDLTLINTVWQHSGNLKMYQIIGFLWNGTDDTWHYTLKRIGTGTMTYSRSVKDFHAMRGNEPRFGRIS